MFSLRFGFLRVSMLWETFQTFVYGNTLLYFGLVGVKIHQNYHFHFFFLPTSNKFAILNNPLTQLRLIFQKTLLKGN